MDKTETKSKYYSSKIPRMNPNLKKKWVEALRSGEYTQGTQHLKVVVQMGEDETWVRYCCLGVICELIPEVPERGQRGTVREFGVDYNTSTLPSEAINTMWTNETFWYLSNNPIVLSAIVPINAFITPFDDPELYGHNYTLAELNDHGFTFSQIADVIDYFL